MFQLPKKGRQSQALFLTPAPSLVINQRLSLKTRPSFWLHGLGTQSAKTWPWFFYRFICLVVFRHPSEKYDFVNWDDDRNPINMGKQKIDGNQTTNQLS